MQFSRLLVLAMSGVGVLADSGPSRRRATQLSRASQTLFDFSMKVQDSRWDDYYKLIWYSSNGPWSVRFTAWYTAGLLHRNQGDDIENARGALEMILACQMTRDYDSAWYGTFKLSPDEPDPTPDSVLYPPVNYGSYDPNWREFVGTQLIQVVEEFPDLIGSDLVTRIEEAVEAAAVGGMRRNGTYPEGDNLVPSYSNPALMRALNAGWIGHRRGNSTLTAFAEDQAQQIYSIFTADGANTLGEYNAPTYYGVDFWALAANIQYGPSNASMTRHSAFIAEKLWDDIADHYNPFLGNLAGPYDRAYTRDITERSAIVSLVLWGIFGEEAVAHPPRGEGDLHYDIAQGAALALVMDTIASTLSDDAAAAIGKKGWWEGSRMLNKTVHESSGEKRVATSWVTAPLMVGGTTVAEEVNRGDQFVPAIIHWAADRNHTPWPYNGFIVFYPSASTLDAVAGPGSLTISYPNTTQHGTDIFTFALSGVPFQWTLAGNTVTGLERLPCLDINVQADGLEKLPITYGSSLRGHVYYNISYRVPRDYAGTPTVKLSMEYTC